MIVIIHKYRPSHWSGLVIKYDGGGHRIGMAWGGGYCKGRAAFKRAVNEAGQSCDWYVRQGIRFGDVMIMAGLPARPCNVSRPEPIS